MPKLIVEKIADIKIMIEKEKKFRETILIDLKKKITTFEEGVHNEYAFNKYILGLKNGYEVNTSDWPIEVTRKIKMALVLETINNRLNSCSATTSLTHKNELFVEVFQDVKTVLSDIEQSRSGHEIIVDFLKSVANQFIYLLTFTMHPGFFSTTNQPLQSVKECVQRSVQLLQDLEEMERLSNVAASPSR